MAEQQSGIDQGQYAGGEQALAISYPHLEKEDVTIEDLKRHFEANPDEYHHLLQPHVRRLIAEHIAAPADEAAEVQAPEREPIDIVQEKIDRMEAGEDVRFSADDASVLTENGREYFVIKSVQKFDSFNEDFAQLVMDKNMPFFIVSYKEKFPTVDEAWVLDYMLRSPRDMDEIFDRIKNHDPLMTPARERMFIDNMAESHGAIVMKLCRHADEFQSLSKQDVVNILYEKEDMVRDIMRFLPSYDGIDQRDLMNRLIGEGGGTFVLERVDKFTEITHAEILSALDWKRDMGTILAKFSHFDSFPQDESFLSALLADDRINESDINKLLDHYERSVVKRILQEEERYDLLFNKIGLFGDLDPNDTFTKAIDGGASPYILTSGLYAGRNFSRATAEAFIESGCTTDVINCIAAFDDLEQTEVGEMALVAGELDMYAAAYYERMPPLLAPEELQKYEERYALLEDPSAYEAYSAMLLRLPEGERPETFRRASNLFGGGMSQGIFGAVYTMLHENRIPKGVRQLGVTEAGWQGAEQLKDIFEAYRREFRSGRISHETETKLAESSILRDALMQFVHYRSSDYGAPSEESFEEIVRWRVESVRDGRAKEDTAENTYPDSEIYNIQLLEKTDLSEDVIHRYDVLMEDIHGAVDALRKPESFKLLINDLKASIQDVIDHYDAIKDIVPETEKNPERRREYMAKKRQRLIEYLQKVNRGEMTSRQFVLASPADVRRNFNELEPFDQLHGPMRKLMFAWAIRKNPQVQQSLEQLPPDPTIQDVARVRDFIDHMVLQETYGDYFPNKKAATKFKDMTSTRAFEEALIHHQEHAKRSEENAVQFIASKGLMLDLSGEIASVCWAGKYKSIAEEFPHVDALIMKSNPGTDNEKLIGSTLLMKTFNPETYQPILLVRGVNPNDSYINKADVGQFYDALTNHVRKLAKEIGMTPAIVIDDHAGGSGSNRQVMHDYLMQMKQTMQQIEVDKQTTKFNGYDVEQKSYLL